MSEYAADVVQVSEKTRKLSFPTSYTVLLMVAAFVALLTWIIPAGVYDKLSYKNDGFVVTYASGESETYPATQEVLTSLGIKTELSKFTSGDIYRPVSIPDSFTEVEANPQGIGAFFQAPIKGMYDSIDVVFFVLVLGGYIGIVHHAGAFTAGIQGLSRILKGREQWLIVIVTTLIAMGGTSFGLAEETIAFYPILVPIFIAAGYDAIVALASVYIGSAIGTMNSTVNPFSTIIASNAAGVNWTAGLEARFVLLIIGVVLSIAYIIRYAERVKKDPSRSLVYSQKAELEAHFLGENSDKPVIMTGTIKLVLGLFAISFLVMVLGVAKFGWWFTEMTTLFFVVALLTGVLARIDEKSFVNAFLVGANDLLGVALIIAIARGVTVLMDQGMISDSLLHWASGFVSGMDKGLFIVVIMLLFSGMAFFVPSSSGMAVLAMPIMAPLADVVGLPRENIVSAYQYGLGLMSFITPTGLVLASLAMMNITFDKWLKFVLPLLGMLTVLSAFALLIGVYL